MGHPAAADSTYTPVQLQEVRYSHEAMIEVLVGNPAMTQRELARMFGRSEVWISTVVRSDAFQVALKARREEVYAPILAPMKEKLEAAAHASIERLHDRLTGIIPMKDNDLIQASKVVLDAAGYGARSRGEGDGGPMVVINLPAKAPDEAAWGARYAPRPLDALVIEAGTPTPAQKTE